MDRSPNDKDDWQNDRLGNAVSDSLSLVIGLIKSVVFICCCLLVYGLFGDNLALAFEEPHLVTEQEWRNRKKASVGDDWDRVENGIHVQTGMIYADGFDIVRGTCTACHSAKLVTQNRATRQGWKDMIVWMQETQGLWDLGANEPIILDYLATHYAPEEVGRRPGLDLAEIEWYILNLEEEGNSGD